MKPRHPCRPERSGRRIATVLPTRWLMTDERMGTDLWRALARMPRGGGVIFRHYSLPPAERRRLFARIRRIAELRGLVLLRAGATRMRGAQGRHGQARSERSGQGQGSSAVVTWPVHSVAEARRARRIGVTAVLVSPVFPTRSHPGAPSLGTRRARAIGLVSGVPIIALGGMNEQRFRRLRGFHGYAAIDAWLT